MDGVVNDERGVALMEEYNKLMTTDEEYVYRKKYPNTKKYTLIS